MSKIATVEQKTATLKAEIATIERNTATCRAETAVKLLEAVKKESLSLMAGDRRKDKREDIYISITVKIR